jgi:hypothetical protein
MLHRFVASNSTFEKSSGNLEFILLSHKTVLKVLPNNVILVGKAIQKMNYVVSEEALKDN